ncbi:MAG: DUF1501 domain-containing protein [Lentisphaeraceae bacterium]|nr:DUF1501 domain-containing protein [Lentisphaeraceae bacterium]
MMDNLINRRNFLNRAGMGMGMLGLSSLVDGAEKRDNPLKARSPHLKSKAKRVIHIFANGGASQMDTFDPKPLLKKYAGKKLPVHYKTERETGGAFPSPFEFKKYGESGMEISELFSELGQHADDLCVVRSMHTNVPNHEPSLMMLNCGDAILPRPSMGSWINYGLGSENDNLPGFIAMCPGGVPIKGGANWRSAFLPGVFQGTHIDTKHTSIDRLIENIRNPRLTRKAQRAQMDLLQEFNEAHLAKREGERELQSRIHNYELAYKMQMEATDAFDIEKEPEHIRKMYGDSFQNRQCLIARRLVERGVRFIQLYHGAGQPWDNHDEIEKGHRRLAGESSQGIAALITDLKQRGLLDETLIVWGGEFGRTPTVELPKPGTNAGKQNGRDHNHLGFTMWMCGGGVKGGTVYGQTDEFGFKAVDKRVHIHDLHATILHLLGLDHEELTYRYSGRDFRLTDVEGYVVNDILA